MIFYKENVKLRAHRTPGPKMSTRMGMKWSKGKINIDGVVYDCFWEKSHGNYIYFQKDDRWWKIKKSGEFYHERMGVLSYEIFPDKEDLILSGSDLSEQKWMAVRSEEMYSMVAGI